MVASTAPVGSAENGGLVTSKTPSALNGCIDPSAGTAVLVFWPELPVLAGGPKLPMPSVKGPSTAGSVQGWYGRSGGASDPGGRSGSSVGSSRVRDTTRTVDSAP